MRMSLAYAGKSAVEMAELLEVHPVTMSRWMNDKRDVKGMVLKLWASETGVNEQWLRTGEAPAEAIVKESCATRDSNPQPSDWWSVVEDRFAVEAFRRALLTLAVKLDDRSLEFFEFLDVLGSDSAPAVFSSQAGLGSFRCQQNIDSGSLIPAGVE